MAKKLSITKHDAIRQCKEIWKLVLDGQARDKYEACIKAGYRYRYLCPLCDYDAQFGSNNCDKCPLVTQLHTECMSIGTHFYNNPKAFAALVMKLKG